MGGDRDGNPHVTPEVTRDVCLSARLMAANLYFTQIEDLMFELSMWRCTDELKERVMSIVSLQKKEAKHYIEFWKRIPPNEPFRVWLGDMRDKLYNTRERMRQMLATGKSDTFTDASQILEPLELFHRSLSDQQETWNISKSHVKNKYATSIRNQAQTAALHRSVATHALTQSLPQ